MTPSFSAWVPRTPSVSWRERLRSTLGALAGILVTGLVCRAAVGPAAALPAMIAPMGASAVLLFAVPASPLAQPWSILGGNVVAALVGVSAGLLLRDASLAAAAAVAVSVALMMSLRCVHPPSGAVALTAVLGGPAIARLGYGFVLWPVLANSALLLLCALLFNRVAGRAYPHRPAAPTPALEPAPRAGFAAADLDAVLADYDQLLDIDRDDLEAILRQAEIRSYRRRAGLATCASVMRRDAAAVSPGAPLADALDLLRAGRVKMLPVTDEGARVLGVVTQSDLLDKATWGGAGPRLGLGRRFGLTLARGRAPQGSVEDVMTAPVPTLAPGAPLADAVRAMARTGLDHLPVAGADGRLAGVVSQSDLVVALLAEAAGRDGAPPRDGPP